MSEGEEGSAARASNRVLRLLSHGQIEVEGRIPWSSNATLLVSVRDGLEATLAVYKPQRGERPLWDFPHGTLGMREVAAYLVSDALGWGFVPPTVLRMGPHGLGSIQLFIDAQEDAHFFTIQGCGEYADELKRLAAFDVLANNADRKSGHCLVDRDGRLWAIDNALTFHPEPKLRTVIWDFADQPLPLKILEGLGGLSADLRQGSSLSKQLAQLLDDIEMAALSWRLDHLLESGRYPEPGPGRAVPWPLV